MPDSLAGHIRIGEQGRPPAEPERYPFIARIYGALSVVAGGLQILAIVLVVLLMLRGRIAVSDIESLANSITTSTVTWVIAAIEMALSAALAVLFFVMGVRLLRGDRQGVALVATVMIALEVGVGLCQVMLSGLDGRLIAPFVNALILIVLQSYSDPALLDERRLQWRLQQLEWRQEAEDGTLGLDMSGKGYITLNFFNLFWIFAICCVIGLVLEVAWHMVVVDPGSYEDRAGMLYGPFSPIYGVGAVLMTVALNRFHDRNPMAIFLVSALIGGAFEFFVSWFMETAFGITAWDYTGTFLSIDGRTNGMFMCMWGVLGLLWVKLCLPEMLKLVNRIPWNWRYGVTVVCATLMIVDAGLTLASLDCWYQREAGVMDYSRQSALVAFCNEHYGDEFMASRFQSMTMNAEDASRA